MNFNFHTHTYRCNHATGTEEEYVLRAIKKGIKFMGFSDHIPFAFPDGFESIYRVPTKFAEDYVKDVNKLKEKYADKIEIHVGFESEYYPEYFDKMLLDAKKWGAEFLILGQHFTKPEYSLNGGVVGRHTAKQTDSVKELNDYANSLIEGMKTGKFSYVCHPDIINFTGNKEDYVKAMHPICVASTKLNIPLEINFLGIRDNRKYPNLLFWELASSERSPVTFGFDSHDVLSAYDEASLEKAKTIVKNLNLNYIGKPKLLPL